MMKYLFQSDRQNSGEDLSAIFQRLILLQRWQITGAKILSPGQEQPTGSVGCKGKLIPRIYNVWLDKIDQTYRPNGLANYQIRLKFRLEQGSDQTLKWNITFVYNWQAIALIYDKTSSMTQLLTSGANVLRRVLCQSTIFWTLNVSVFIFVIR